MVIKVYWASVTANRKIDGDQTRLRNVIESRKLESEWTDITTSRSTMVEMRHKCGNPKAIPPQIFNDDVYLGNVDDMNQSIEDGRLMEWLRIEPSSQSISITKADITHQEPASFNSEPDVSSQQIDTPTTVEPTPCQNGSPDKDEVDSTKISRKSFELNATQVTTTKVDEDRRRRILGIASPSSNSEQEPQTESNNSEDVAKLRSFYEVKDAA